MKLNNKYFALRHGEAVSNAKSLVSCSPEKFDNHLTKKGISKIKKIAKELKNKNIDIIFASPLLRTKETAEIIATALNLKIKFDKRLRELGFGTFNGKSTEEFLNFFKEGLEDRIKNKPKGGENYEEVSKRVFAFLKEINKKHKGKNILIVSHQAPILFLRAKIEDESAFKNTEKLKKILGEKKVTKGELIELN